MILSILIPTFNQNCVALVQSLAMQLPDNCEIVVADDCSTEKKIKYANRELAGLQKVIYWESDTNLGRARIRNRLAELSKGEYLLYIDSDAIVETTDYINRYLACLPTTGVVCGGILHPDVCPSPKVTLRWKYEKECESHFTAEQRNNNPYQSLRTFNILMHRTVVVNYPFDETIKQYGYEDTLFGSELQHNGIKVLHIDNPLTNSDIESNDIFLRKTEEALRTLFNLRNRMIAHSTLLRCCHKLHRYHITKIVLFFYRLTKTAVRKNLIGNHPSVWLFQFYKLGYYLDLPIK